MVNTLWRICLECDKTLEKDSNFTKDQWKCNHCFAKDPTKIVQDKPAFAASKKSRQVWKTLFDYLDDKNLGFITRDAIEDSMKSMMGGFHWEDADGNAQMDFEEFVKCMSSLPASTRVAAQQYASHLTPGVKRKPMTADLTRSPSALKPGDASASFILKKREESTAWVKLFNHLDQNQVGKISTQAVREKMSKMLGTIDWTPLSGKSYIDANDLKVFMDQLPSNIRYSAVSWANSMLDEMGRRSSFGSFRKSSQPSDFSADIFGPMVVSNA